MNDIAVTPHADYRLEHDRQHPVFARRSPGGANAALLVVADPRRIDITELPLHAPCPGTDIP
jgi:hypothetical protein